MLPVHTPLFFSSPSQTATTTTRWLQYGRWLSLLQLSLPSKWSSAPKKGSGSLGSFHYVSTLVINPVLNPICSDCPGRHWLWLHPFNFITLLLGPRFPPRGWFAHFDARFSQYAKEGATILSGVIFGSFTPTFLVSDPEGLKAITSDRHTFAKDLSAYEHVNIYGKSLVTTDGDEWRRHLHVAGPAFSEANNALVYRETRRLILEWFATEFDGSSQLPVDPTKPGEVPRTMQVDVLAKMTQATLHIISSAGFGMRAHWSAYSDPHANLKNAGRITPTTLIPFHTALELTLSNLFLRMLAPTFLYKLPFGIRIPGLSDKLDIASASFASMKTHMERVVEGVKRGEEQSVVERGEEEMQEEAQASDLLRRLVKANLAMEEEGSKNGEKGTLTEVSFSDQPTWERPNANTQTRANSSATFSYVVFFISPICRMLSIRLTPNPNRCSSSPGTRPPPTPSPSRSSSSPSTQTSNAASAPNPSPSGPQTPSCTRPRTRRTTTSSCTRWRSSGRC